ncbi:MAG: xanthine dehydrogenase family protein molybdopterin-binding subunit [Hyphomicrobiales bacterium]|nr:xanthine dehydrogenase family protein molybdopterin-binding subunit [Hyphomicrobiales bacterium]
MTKGETVEAWSACDIGKAINPMSVEGQIQGGFVQGLGFALFEEVVWDGARIANPSLMDYKIATTLDVPAQIHPLIIEDPEPDGPFGAKGIGEIPICAVAPAIANGIAAATGVRLGSKRAARNRQFLKRAAPGVPSGGIRGRFRD